ncbi:MAG: hypothetical protein JXA54_06475 [Candidatus Heimdallarchaeota archaeon]|nr:hypothetical protein [Candidatus Heimdallarchaeota archaeon]
MINKRENQSRKPSLLTGGMRKKESIVFCVLFFCFLLWFSNIFLAACYLPITINEGLTTEAKQDDSSFTTVEFTFLARYPANRTTRGLGFAMQDNYIYSIMDYNPTIIDVSNISNPTFVAEYPVENSRMNTLALRGDYLYLGSSDGLEILNISDLSNITKVGQCNTTNPVRKIVLQGDYGYLAAENSGLVIVNITDPTNPFKISSYKTNIDTWDIALKGSIIFIANTNRTDSVLVVVDVSDPMNPTKIGCYDNSGYPEMLGLSITINGSYAYLGTEEHGLFVLEITNITQPQLISHFYGNTEQTIGEHGNEEIVGDTFVKEQYVFESAGATSLYVLDFSEPANPKLLGQYSGAYLMYGVHVHDTYLFLQDVLLGIMILNMTFSNTTGRPPGQLIAIIVAPILGVGIITVIVTLYKKKKC